MVEISIRQMSKFFGAKQVFSNVSFDIMSGERVGLIGSNGCGKTTLLNIITGAILADGGDIHLGAGLSTGYLPQEVVFEDEEQTLLDYFARRHRISTSEARSALARVLFCRDDVYKQIKNLSGGEKSRLMLCSLFHDKVNFLIMDEPTNHLDIESREVLEHNLQAYEGTLLFTSHDRYFIEKVASQILVMEQGRLQVFRMGYADYCAARQQR